MESLDTPKPTELILAYPNYEHLTFIRFLL
jgi:hypothetical protein